MKVSIHALLAECDLHYHITLNYVQRFNPRTPCGVRLLALLQVSRLTRFQSTHSLRSATGFAVLHGSCDHSFNPRTPCGVRPTINGGGKVVHVVSIHALLAECDGIIERGKPSDNVSIHALLAECDHTPAPIVAVYQSFQSTHSLRSATGSGQAGIRMR